MARKLPANFDKITVDDLAVFLAKNLGSTGEDAAATYVPMAEALMAKSPEERKADVKALLGIAGRKPKAAPSNALTGEDIKLKAAPAPAPAPAPRAGRKIKRPTTLAMPERPTLSEGILMGGPPAAAPAEAMAAEAAPTLAKQVMGKAVPMAAPAAAAETAAVPELEAALAAGGKGGLGKTALVMALLGVAPMIIGAGVEGRKNTRVRQALGEPNTSDYLTNMRDQANMTKMQQLLLKHDPTLMQGMLNMLAGVPPSGFDLTDSEVRIGAPARQATMDQVDPTMLKALLKNLEK